MTGESIKELQDAVTKKFKGRHLFKWKGKSLHYGLETSNGVAWYPLCMAPVNIEKYVNNWLKLGGGSK